MPSTRTDPHVTPSERSSEGISGLPSLLPRDFGKPWMTPIVQGFLLGKQAAYHRREPIMPIQQILTGGKVPVKISYRRRRPQGTGPTEQHGPATVRPRPCRGDARCPCRHRRDRGRGHSTKGAIIPAAVGVDIGCGMNAVRLSLKAGQLPDNLRPCAMSSKRPCRSASTCTRGTRRAGLDRERPVRRAGPHRQAASRYSENAEERRAELDAATRHPGRRQPLHRTVPGRKPEVWVMLHSGSRPASATSSVAISSNWPGDMGNTWPTCRIATTACAGRRRTFRRLRGRRALGASYAMTNAR